MSQESLKRKRASESGSSESRKRVALDATEESKIRVSHISNGSATATAPVVATAPGLLTPQKATFKAYHKSRKQARHGRQQELLLRSSDHPQMDYTAREEDESSATGQLRHYVGVFDPETKALQVVEARNMNGLSQRQELGLEFGTKKAKKAIASITEDAIAPQKKRDISPSSQQAALKNDPKTAAVLKSMACAAKAAPTREMMQAATDEGKPRPRANVEAENVEDVYDEEDVFGDRVLMALKVKPWVDAINEDKEVNVHSQFVAKRIATYVQNDNIKGLKMLKYVLLLVNFFNASRKGRMPKERILPRSGELSEKLREPEAVIEIVKQRFTVNDGRLSSWHVDNLITHIAVATLIIDEFETDIHDICEDLGLKLAEMVKYFAEAGTKVTSLGEPERMRQKLSKGEGTMHKIARLKVPVDFPRERKPIRNKRR